MSNVLEKIEEIFSVEDKFSPENMERLIQETLSFFYEMQEKLESNDPKVKEEAMALAEALKTKLEEQAKILCEANGMDPSKLENYLEEPSNFSEEEWKAIEQAKSDIAFLQQDLKPEKKPKKKKKAAKEWLIG